MNTVLTSELSKIYLNAYRDLAEYAYSQSSGRLQEECLLRAYHYYAKPLLDYLWEEEPQWQILHNAQVLVGYLLWLASLADPGSYLRMMESEPGNNRTKLPVLQQH